MPTPPTQPKQLTALIRREGDGFAALCPDLDVASQGDTVEETRANLVEALDDHDDAQGVYADFDVSDTELARISEAG